MHCGIASCFTQLTGRRGRLRNHVTHRGQNRGADKRVLLAKIMFCWLNNAPPPPPPPPSGMSGQWVLNKSAADTDTSMPQTPNPSFVICSDVPEEDSLFLQQLEFFHSRPWNIVTLSMMGTVRLGKAPPPLMPTGNRSRLLEVDLPLPHFWFVDRTCLPWTFP